jgi:hypothetical protein
LKILLRDQRNAEKKGTSAEPYSSPNTGKREFLGEGAPSSGVIGMRQQCSITFDV